MRVVPLVLLSALLVAPAAAQPEVRPVGGAPGGATGPRPLVAAGQPEVRPVGGPVSFHPLQGTHLRLGGVGPLRGSLEVRRGGGGLVVVEETDLESYLQGLAEVPPDWPAEALKAQAVAARTYALWERERGVWKRQGFDVCATASCQVYGGMAAERDRWVEAVRATRGEVLLYEGHPALARYHASSGGETLPNEVVFPQTGRLPYLKGIPDPADADSPLHRWTVSFDAPAMEAILREGLGIRGPVESIDVDASRRVVRIRAGGRERTVGVAAFRRAVSRWAPRLYPGRYPAPRADGRPMPETLPSSRFEVHPSDGGWVFEGRGYGHGVGMSQWGAYGRALRGEGYREILSAYYGGLRPVRWRGPARLRVGVVTGAPSVTVSGSGRFSVRVEDEVVAASTVGTWSVTSQGPRALGLRPPEGYDLPLVLSGVSAQVARGAVQVGFVIPKAAEVEVSASGRRAREVFEAGSGSLRLPLPPGRHVVRVSATDGLRRVSRSVSVEIPRGGLPPAAAGAAAAVAALAVLATLRRRGRGASAGPQPAGQSSAMPERGQPSQG